MTRPKLSDLPAALITANRAALAHHAFHPHPAAVLAPLRAVRVKRQSISRTSAAKSDMTGGWFIVAGLPEPVREHRFHSTRQWRFDWAWIDAKIALEIDGGLFVNGGHSRGKAREGDYEKDAHALMLGWRVLRVSTDQFRAGKAVEWLKAILPAPLPQRVFADHLGGRNDEA